MFTPLTIYFLYFVFSRPESQLCTSQNRTDTCIEEEWNPVCALYTGSDCHSSTGYCYRTLFRTCDACADSNIIGYAPGECEEPAFPKLCTQEQVGASCSDDNKDSKPVCGYAKMTKSERLRGKNSVSQAFSSECEACSSDHSVFSLLGECKDSGEVGICRLSYANDKCSETESETLCAYYTEGCEEDLCRKTVTKSTCGVCDDASVLFYVKGSCEFVEAVAEDVEELILDDLSDQQEVPIPELEAVLSEDGTVVYDEVKPEKEEIDDVEQQDDIPLLTPVMQDDGTYTYEVVEPKEEETYNQPQEDVPELEAVIQEDGSVVYEDVRPPQKQPVYVDCVVPEVEVIEREDGLTVFEPVAPVTTDEPVVQQKLSILRRKAETLLEKVMASGTDIPVIETVSQEEEQSVQDEIDYVEPQENIPLLQAVIQEDGSVIYEEVQAQELCVEVASPNEEVELFVPNEEATVVSNEDEESQKVEAVELLETRLLAEPDN